MNRGSPSSSLERAGLLTQKSPGVIRSQDRRYAHEERRPHMILNSAQIAFFILCVVFGSAMLGMVITGACPIII